MEVTDGVNSILGVMSDDPPPTINYQMIENSLIYRRDI